MKLNTNAWNRLRYTLWAPGYDLLARFANKRRRSIAAAKLQSGERVLLLGAGTGMDLAFLPRDVQLTAIDLTPAMLERLRARAQALELPVETRVMDGQALEFPDGAFDVVILHLIVAVIPDPLRCLKETARVLRPGGRAVILDKLAPDGRRPPWYLRLFNPVIGFLATEITRQLGPLLAASGLEKEHDEDAGLFGLFRIVVARKPKSPSR